MHGFDPKFKDFPDFLFSVTEEIWELRGLGAKMREYYSPDVITRSPNGIAVGAEVVLADAMAELVGFPDQKHLGEDVIWSGAPQFGMLGSQRILSVATHQGPGIFGEPTGRRVMFRTIADRYAKANRIHEEWMVCDTGAVLRQLGLTPSDWARERAEALGSANRPFHPDNNEIGPYTGQGNDNQWGAALADLITRCMAGEMSVFSRQYDRACQLSYIGGQEAHGREAADTFWLGLRAAFPSAEFKIHHQIGLEEPLMPARAALRWSLTGGHDGWGLFGAPTGKPVHVMGITHAEFGPWGLRREWTIFDEAAIWLQIHSTAA
jgi:predicted ester cyclase